MKEKNTQNNNKKIRENYYQEDEGHWSDDDSIDEYEVDLSEEIRKDSH